MHVHAGVPARQPIVHSVYGGVWLLVWIVNRFGKQEQGVLCVALPSLRPATQLNVGRRSADRHVGRPAGPGEKGSVNLLCVSGYSFSSECGEIATSSSTPLQILVQRAGQPSGR